MKTLKNILVTTDFSEYSKPAIEEAALLAEKFNANLYVMHVVEQINDCAADYCISDAQLTGEKNKLLKEAEKKLAENIAVIKDKFHVSAIPEIRYGETYEEILIDEKEKNIDLVVMTPHKRNRVSKFFTHLTERISENSVSDTLLMGQHA
jgi:nucleotide-binding universal stress UspA family protein